MQMVQFECPRVIHPLLSFIFGVHCVVSFPCRKREILHVVVYKVEIHFAKIGFVDSIWSNLIAPGSYTT